MSIVKSVARLHRLGVSLLSLRPPEPAQLGTVHGSVIINNVTHDLYEVKGDRVAGGNYYVTMGGKRYLALPRT